MAKTKIEWTATKLEDGTMVPGYSFNPWWGCVKVSPGCKNCYAEKLSNRFGDWWGKDAERRFFGDKHWGDPLKWNRKAKKEGVRYKVFCGSMCDVFEEKTGLMKQRSRLWELIKNTPNLDWLLLTKRPEYISLHTPALWTNGNEWPDNVWIGTSIENQEQADKRIPELLKIPAKVRFLSCEPLLGRIDLLDLITPTCLDCDAYILGHREEGDMKHYEERLIDWIIVGGESGSNARPMHPDWATSLQYQCAEASIPFFFKQWGAWKHIYESDSEAQRLLGEHEIMYEKVGKKKAGRLLDGELYNEFPNTD